MLRPEGEAISGVGLSIPIALVLIVQALQQIITLGHAPEIAIPYDLCRLVMRVAEE
jgi:hypothetical protein